MEFSDPLKCEFVGCAMEVEAYATDRREMISTNDRQIDNSGYGAMVRNEPCRDRQ